MTAVHISILRNVLQDDGKENEFLKWFVISVFSVQIIVGLVSLYVGLLRKYYRKHGQDFATECWYLLPCFKCRKPQSPSKNENEETRSMSHSTPLKSTCCPLECVSVNLPYDDFELKTLSMYDDLKAKLFSSHKGQEEMAPLLNKEKNSLLHKQVEELEHIVEHIESERLMKRITFCNSFSMSCFISFLPWILSYQYSWVMLFNSWVSSWHINVIFPIILFLTSENNLKVRPLNKWYKQNNNRIHFEGTLKWILIASHFYVMKHIWRLTK